MCTGNMYGAKGQQAYDAVYPCVYREHSIRITEFAIDNGLSLCVQGTFI